MTDQSDYTLTWQPSTTKGKIILRCVINDETIFHDELNIARDKDRIAACKKLTELGCDQLTLGKELLSIANEFASISPRRNPSDEMRIKNPLDSMDPDCVSEAEHILTECTSILELVYEDAQAVGVVGEQPTVLTLYLAGVSRLLSKPLSVIVQGSSSSGKSYLVEAVAELFPDETKLVAQQMTPNSLYYLPEGALKNRIIVAGERSRVEDDDRAEATRALREMLASGKLKKLVPVRTADGTMTTQIIKQDGPISFWESTTLGQIFDEDRNRCVLVHTDESAEQTRRILIALANNRLNKSIERQHAIQRLLQPLSVVVPYAEQLASCYPPKKSNAVVHFPIYSVAFEPVLYFINGNEFVMSAVSSWLMRATTQQHSVCLPNR